MSKTEIIERERRWGRPVIAACFLLAALLIASMIVTRSVDLGDADEEAEFLRAFDPESGTLFVAAILQGLGLALIAAPLLYLFRATQARSPAVRGALIGLTVAGPVLLGAAVVGRWAAIDAVAADFVATNGAECSGLRGTELDDCVEDLIADNGTFGVAQAFTLAGTLGLAIAMVYTCLHAMRVGLLTRFMGTLGMALGVSVIFLGYLPIILYAVALGFLFAGLWIGGRPPAWAAGEAVLWPRPGEEPGRREEAEGEEIPARAEEVFPESGTERAGGDAASSKRKRKRRR